MSPLFVRKVVMRRCRRKGSEDSRTGDGGTWGRSQVAQES